MPKDTEDKKSKQSVLDRIKIGKRDKGKPGGPGAGFDAQSKALNPNQQPGFNAQAAALVPGKMPPLPMRPGQMPPLPQVPGKQMPPLPQTPIAQNGAQNGAQVPVAPPRPTTAPPTQGPARQPVTVADAAPVLTDKNEKKDRFGRSKAKSLKGGTKNEVTRVEYDQGIGGGEQTKGFWKQGQTEGASAASKIGLEKKTGQELTRPSKKDPTKMIDKPLDELEDTDDPRMAARSVATSRLDKALGTNVIADEAFAYHKGELGNVSAEVDGRALVANQTDKKGELVSQDIAKVDAKDPAYQRSMANLGVMDYLTGQVDRHGGNIFYDPKTGTVKGIDNDLAFGQFNHQNAAGVGYGAALEGLPKQIDAETAGLIRDMSVDEFRKTLEPRPGDPQALEKAEIDKSVERFLKMKVHIAQLAKSGLLVQQWDDATYADACNDVDGSYLGRHQELVGTAGQGRLGAAGGSAETVTDVPRANDDVKPKGKGKS